MFRATVLSMSDTNHKIDIFPRKKIPLKIIETLYMSGHEHRQETGILYENIASQNEKSFLVAPGNFKV